MWLLTISLVAMARPAAPWGEDVNGGEFRCDKQNWENVTRDNKKKIKQAQEQNAKRGPNSPLIKPMLVDTPCGEYDPPLYQILQGIPLSVYIWKSPNNKRMDYDEKVLAAFDSWFKHAEIFIRGRDEEFADVLPIFQRGVLIQSSYVSGTVPPPSLPRNSIGLNIFNSIRKVEEYCESERVIGCVEMTPHSQKVYMHKDDPEFQTTLEHEVGHLLGLGDEHNGLSSEDRKDYFSSNYSEIRPNRKRRGGALMDGRTPDIRCDDVDGLINIIDLWNRCSSQRTQRGWKSLCGDGTIYRCEENESGENEIKTYRERRKS